MNLEVGGLKASDSPIGGRISLVSMQISPLASPKLVAKDVLAPGRKQPPFVKANRCVLLTLWFLQVMTRFRIAALSTQIRGRSSLGRYVQSCL